MMLEAIRAATIARIGRSMDRSQLSQRLAAILAADAAGFSRRMAEDEHGTVAALDAARTVFRGVIEVNRGRVVDMAGDSVLAVFDSATSAVHAAMTIQSALQDIGGDQPEAAPAPLRFRIGVHLGDVIEKTDGTVYGDGVNVASRLQALVTPGAVGVSDAVRAAVGTRSGLVFDDLGPQTMKHIAEPVRAFQVNEASARTQARASADVAKGPHTPAAAPPARPSPAARARALAYLLRDWRVVAVLVLVAVAAVVWNGQRQHPKRAPTAAARPVTVAVLPFVSADSNASDAALATDVASTLTHWLTQWSLATVVGSGQSRAAQAGASDASSIGRSLGVQFLVEGETRRSGEHVTLTTRIVVAATGVQAWSRSFEWRDGDGAEERGRMQMRVVSRTRGGLLLARRQQVSLESATLTPFDLVTLGYRVWTDDRDAWRAAAVYIDKALKVDPDFAPALVARATLLDREIGHTERARVPALIAELDATSSRAVAADRRSDSAWYVRASALAYQGRMGEALEAIDAALQLAPFSQSHMTSRANVLHGSGDQLAAAAAARKAIDMDPPGGAYQSRVLCLALMFSGEYQRAVVPCERAATLATWFDDQLVLVALYTQLGQPEKALRARQELLRQRPAITVEDSALVRGVILPSYRAQFDQHVGSALLRASIPPH